MKQKLEINKEKLALLPKTQQEKALKALEELEFARKANPLLFYKPHQKQHVFHSFTSKNKIFLGSNQCLAGDTGVRMADGTVKPIRKVRAGDWVFGVDMEGNTRPVKVLEKYANGVRPVYRFRFEKRGRSAEVLATEDHKILGRVKKRRDKLRLGDMKLRSRGTDSHWQAQRARGFDLPPAPGEGWASVLGLMLGDGCTTKKQPVAQFTNVDEDIIDLMRTELAAKGYRLDQNQSNPIQFLIRGGTVPFLTVAEGFGMRCYAHEKRIPEECFRWSNDAVGKLIAGLWLTDGCIYRSAGNRCVAGLSSGSLEMLEDTQRLLEERFGIYAPITGQKRADKKRPEYNLKISSRASLERFAEVIPLIGYKADRISTYLDAWESNRHADAARLQFRSKEFVADMPTYDLLVDHPDHLFLLGNGLVVSNSGKTTASTIDSIVQAIDETAVPEHLKPYKKFRPPFRCWIAGNTREVVETVIFQKLQEWMPKDQLVGGDWSRAYDKQLHTLHFKNGSAFAFRTYEQEVDKWGGASVDRVVFDEEPPPGHFGEGRIRTMARGGDLVFSFTPTNGLSHMYEWMAPYIEKADRNSGQFEGNNMGLVIVEMDDNPALSEEEKEMAMVGFSKEERLARKHGRFVALHGLIYSDFDPDTHIVPALDALPENVNVYVGIDPGIRHACGVLWTYMDTDNRLVVFDEGYFKDMTIPQVCEQIHSTNARWGVRPLMTVIDPAARNRASQTGRSDQMAFADHGVMSIAGQNDVAAGINQVKLRLEENSLFIADNCENLIREIKRYRWQKPGRTEHESPDRPVKKDDHLLDPLRYVCMARPYAKRVEAVRDETPEQRWLREDQEKAFGSVNGPKDPLGW